jgi:hypothetical protein
VAYNKFDQYKTIEFGTITTITHKYANLYVCARFARYTVFLVLFQKVFVFYYCFSTCLQYSVYNIKYVYTVFLMIYDGLFQICRYKNLATSSIISSCQPITKEPNIGRSIKEKQKKIIIIIIINYKNSP